MSGLFLGIGAKVAESAVIGKATGILTAIPKPVWEAIAVIGYVVALICLHQHTVHQHDAALIAANNAQWQVKLDAETAQMRQKDAQLADMASQLRKANDETHSSNAADAGALSLRGPGKAACPRLPGAPAAPGGPATPPAKPDVAGPALPPDDLAGVSWQWLVGRAQEHDDLLADDKAWRDWYAQVVKAWPKATSAPSPPR